MSEAEISQKYVDALETIANIDKNIYEQIYTSLSEYDCSNREQLVSFESLVEWMESQLTEQEISINEINNLVGFLLSAYSTISSHDITSDEFVDSIFDVLDPFSNRDISEEELYGSKEKILKLLEIEVLRITAKGYELMAEYDKLFLRSRIVTDIRPVFLDSEEDVSTPASAVIVHSLKITYREGEEIKYFYAAMDSNDIKQLRTQIDRAEAKSEIVKNIIRFPNKD